MPKENINCSDESDTRVVVAWRSAPEGHVQVATENPDGSVSVVDEQITGWYVTLNRLRGWSGVYVAPGTRRSVPMPRNARRRGVCCV